MDSMSSELESESGAESLLGAVLDDLTALVSRLDTNLNVLFANRAYIAVFAPDASLERAFGWLHFLGGCALTGLAGLHIGAALKHQFINGDTVLPSMLPNLSILGKVSRK